LISYIGKCRNPLVDTVKQCTRRSMMESGDRQVQILRNSWNFNIIMILREAVA